MGVRREERRLLVVGRRETQQRPGRPSGSQPAALETTSHTRAHIAHGERRGTRGLSSLARHLFSLAVRVGQKNSRCSASSADSISTFSTSWTIET